MRLRFGRPSLSLLIFFAVIAGMVFYYFDNRNPENTVQPVETSVAIATEDASIVTAQATIAPTATRATRFTSSTRQELPGNTSIFIPTAGVWSNVIQAYLDNGNWDISNLRSNAGHLEGTAWVDQPGNTVISGHVELANGRSGVFGALEDIVVGDVITVISEGLEYNYVVIETYHTVPTDLAPLRPTTDSRLTLITCNSYDIVTNAYRERLIVVAERVG